MKKQTLFGLLLASTSTIAMAHPGHGMESAYAGFMHPLTGLDHLLVMLAVGLWAGKLGGKACWQLPLTFMLVMAFGAMLGMSGATLPGMETAIAASVMTMGLLLLMSLSLKPTLRIGIIATFALLHGLAHGSELAQENGLQVLAGMLMATGLLHGAGLLLGSQRLRLAKGLQKTFGLLIMLAGGYLLIAG